MIFCEIYPNIQIFKQCSTSINPKKHQKTGFVFRECRKGTLVENGLGNLRGSILSSQRANTNPRLTMKTAECLRMCDHLVDNRHQRVEY